MLAPDSENFERQTQLRRDVLADAPEFIFEVVKVREYDDLNSRTDEWNRLVATAIEPNAFFEPALLLPGLKHLAENDQPEFVLLYARQKANHQAEKVLCGMFPIQRRVKYRKRAFLGVSTWMHTHCFLGTPLVRGDCAVEVLHAFFDWLAGDGRARAIFLPLMHAGGPFGKALTAVIQQRESVWFVQQQISRTQFEPDASADEFMQHVWSRKTRHEVRRQQRRLGEKGKVEFKLLSKGDDLSPWLDSFLELESRGWKGDLGTAFASSENERAYFVESLTNAHQNEQLHMLSMELAGEPIAMNSAFLSADGGYYFKIAYDELLAKYSPGVILEAEFLRVLHERPDLRWFDSCAAANHPMIERLWDRRRLIQSVWVSTGSAVGDAWVGMLATINSLEQCGVKWLKPLYRKWWKRK